jgi:hypothetical protein
MGIKFHCPNGHKLNVKAFLAGKKGVCPKCGTKVRIPLASEAGLVDSEMDEAGGEAGSVMIPNGNGAIAAAMAASGTPAIGAATAGTGTAISPPMPPVSTTPAGVRDPIAEAPTAIWYVRPPSGGQYGPARGDVMRTWLSEGRVSSDSFVWRDGWTDWRIAGQLFPDLQGGNSASAVAAAPALIHTAQPVVRTQAKPRNNNSLAIGILAGLAVMILLLLVALGYILFIYR